MDDARPSLVRRAVAALVLLVAAVVVLRLVIGAITAVFWTVALIAAVLAALWAWWTLRSSWRDFEERRAQKRAGRQERKAVGPTPAASARPPVAAPARDVDAELRRMKEQLRDEGGR